MSNLIQAMQEVNDLNRTHGVVQRGGKKYTEVFVRVEAFRKAFGTDLGIDTEICVDDGSRVVVRAQIVDKTGAVIGSGFAEEIRGQGNVNKTSALENCETSAIGRALASLGLHGGTYASINEMDGVQRKAQAQQAAQPTPAPAEPAPKGFPSKDQAVAWCKSMVAKYNAAQSARELAEIDRNTPDEHLDALKHGYPDLYNLLVERFTQKEKSYA